MAKNSATLKDTLKDCLNEAENIVDQFPWNHKGCYSIWLNQTYQMVKYTTRFASLVAGSLDFEDEDIHQSLLHHLSEENHHEKLAQSDLKKLGHNVEELEILLETKLLVQSQFYFIEMNPLSHFGFVLFLESLGASRGHYIFSEVKKAYSNGCDSFIKAHADLDGGHSEEVEKLVRRLQDRISLQKLLTENLKQSAGLYCNMLTNISRLGVSDKTSNQKAS